MATTIQGIPLGQQERLVVYPDGRVVREVCSQTTYAGNLRDIFANEDRTIFLKLTPPLVQHPAGQVHLLFNGDPEEGAPYALIHLERVNFVTDWDIIDEQTGDIGPVFRRNGDTQKPFNPAVAGLDRLWWAIPSGLSVWLVVEMSAPHRAFMPVFVDSATKAAQIDKRPAGKVPVFRPPFPNIFDNGTLCWKPRNDGRPTGPTLIDRLNTLLDDWINGVWNLDLLTDNVNIALRWTKDGDQKYTSYNQLIEAGCDLQRLTGVPVEWTHLLTFLQTFEMKRSLP